MPASYQPELLPSVPSPPRTAAWRKLARYVAGVHEGLVSATLSRITADPTICGGQPCIRAMRFPVATVLRYLAGRYTAEQLVAEFPELELEDIRESLRYAAWLASGRFLALPPAA